jgi:hypothetical protein
MCRRSLPAILAVMLTACAHAGSAVSQEAWLAQPCPAIPSRPVRSGFKRAFLELASVHESDLPRRMEQLGREPIRSRAVGGMLSEHEAPLAIDWDRCLDARCELKLSRKLMIAAELPQHVDEPVRISVHIREHNGSDVSVYAEHAETRNQRAVAIDDHGDRTRLVVTPYLLSDDADAQALLMCKKARRDEQRGQGNK